MAVLLNPFFFCGNVSHAMYIWMIHFFFLTSLYRGKVGLDVAEAQHLMDGLDWQGAVKDITASVNWLKANGSKKVGHCLCFQDKNSLSLKWSVICSTCLI